MGKKNDKKGEQEKKVVELNEIESIIFDTARQLDKCCGLARAIKYMAREENSGENCPYSHAFFTIAKNLASELDITNEGFLDFVQTEWEIKNEAALERALLA